MQCVTLTTPGTHVEATATAAAGVDGQRQFKEAMEARRHPQSLATLPRNDPRGRAEFQRATGELGMRGRCCSATSTASRSPDERFRPIYEAANDMGASCASTRSTR
jgi:hypothetical protein